MDVRPAEPDDRVRIEEIVRQSFQTSYALSPQQIDTIAEEVFSGASLADRIDDPDHWLFVVDGDKEGEPMVVGVADVEVGEEATLRWLHVEPGARGGGAGTALFEHARKKADDEGIPLTARILEQASEGSEFPEQFGLDPDEDVDVDIGGETFHEQIYRAGGEDTESNEPEVDVPETVDVDGEALPVDRDDEIPGTESPFFRIYAEQDSEERYGFFCSNCGSTDVSGDDLDRLECGNCGNMHRAEDWDSAYL